MHQILPASKRSKSEKIEAEKPLIFDLDEDLDLLMPEYDKHFNYYHDYFNCFYIDFMNRISLTGGKFGEVISLRSRFLSGSKMEKDEKKSAFKLLTKEQLAWYEKKTEYNEAMEGLSMLSAIPNMALENRKRRLKERGKNGK